MAKKPNWQNRIVGYGVEDADQLLANDKNWRIHPQFQQDSLTGILDTIGWVQNVIVNKRSSPIWGQDRSVETVVDGHLRIALAISRNEQVPVTYVDLDPNEEATILASIDPIAALAVADKDQLDTLLKQVNSDDARVQELLSKLAEDVGLYKDPPAAPDAQVDRAAELQEKWQCERGQLWEIGKHRLLCGNSTNVDDVARVMGKDRAAICFTSPPYNAGVSAQLSGNTSIDDNLYKDEYDDNQSQGAYLKLLGGFTDLALKHAEYTFVNLQVLAGNKTAFVEYWHRYLDKFADVAIWDKQHAAPAAAQRVMDSRFEFIIVLSHSGNRAIGTREFRGMVHNVYSGSPQRNNDYADMHAATFPLELPQHFIGTFTNPFENVYEPFAGTGTTIAACETLKRYCRAIELSPAYCAVILERMSAMQLEPRLVE